MGESGESYAFDRDGRLISRSRFEEDLQRIGLIASGEHRLGRVPLVTVYNVASRKYPRCGASALADIAPVNRSIFNWCSLNDEFLYRQCFNILAIPDYPMAGKRRRTA